MNKTCVRNKDNLSSGGVMPMLPVSYENDIDTNDNGTVKFLPFPDKNTNG